MFTVAWPAILLASMALPPTSWRMVMLARRKECRPKPTALYPAAFAGCQGYQIFLHIGSGLDEPRLPRRVWFWARPRRRVATLVVVGAVGATWANVALPAGFVGNRRRGGPPASFT
jgi:hypothetical protein